MLTKTKALNIEGRIIDMEQSNINKICFCLVSSIASIALSPTVAEILKEIGVITTITKDNNMGFAITVMGLSSVYLLINELIIKKYKKKKIYKDYEQRYYS